MPTGGSRCGGRPACRHPGCRSTSLQRLGRDLQRYLPLRADIDTLEWEVEVLLALTGGQVLTSLPEVASTRAAAFAVHRPPTHVSSAEDPTSLRPRALSSRKAAADGDGQASYAAHLTARRRKLACRPFALGRPLRRTRNGVASRRRSARRTRRPALPTHPYDIRASPRFTTGRPPPTCRATTPRP